MNTVFLQVHLCRASFQHQHRLPFKTSPVTHSDRQYISSLWNQLPKSLHQPYENESSSQSHQSFILWSSPATIHPFSLSQRLNLTSSTPLFKGSLSKHLNYHITARTIKCRLGDVENQVLVLTHNVQSLISVLVSNFRVLALVSRLGVSVLVLKLGVLVLVLKINFSMHCSFLVLKRGVLVLVLDL